MINLIAIETSADENFNTMENDSEVIKGKEGKISITYGDWTKRENMKTPSTLLGARERGIEHLLMKAPDE